MEIANVTITMKALLAMKTLIRKKEDNQSMMA